MSSKRSMSLTVSHFPAPLVREVKNSTTVSRSGRRHSMFTWEPRQSLISGISRKDRSRKKREGTPDKSTTPSQEQDESSTLSKNVIWNEEIEKMQIRLEELQKVWPPQPPTAEKTFVKVSVQKTKKVAKMEEVQSKIITIAKPAPPEFPVQPMDYSGFAGPRYSKAGEVIPYSLLGTYEDFYKEASRRGKMCQNIPAPQGDLDRAETPPVKYEKKKRHSCLDNPETNALRNWYNRMMERKKQQGYMSKLLQKSPEDLVMNQSDNYHAIQKQRYLIDRTIPNVDYGKGYRVGSEFWYQQEQFGDDQTGLHMTLTQTQRGYPPPIEHVGLSQVVKEEKGCEWLENDNYRWHKSEFLDQRRMQLQPYIKEVDPWTPDFDFLQIIGSSKPQNIIFCETQNENEVIDANLDSLGDQIVEEPNQDDNVVAQCEVSKEIPSNDLTTVKVNEPAFGPSLLFGGRLARWTGDRLPGNDMIGIETIVNFEASSGDRITSYLELTNDGTTSIYYDWKKMPKENSFGLEQNMVQRFYFNNSSGVILPGDTLKFPFVFKSTNAGVFTEQWKLETRPVLCCGAALLVTLRGVALQRDKFKVQREELEKELFHKQAKQVVSYLLHEMVNGIRTPESCKSPIDAYITEEEIFLRNNPGLNYNHGTVTQLKDIYRQLFDADVQAENVWSLSINDLQDSILLLNDEEEDKREMLLNQMNSVVGKLTYIPHDPLEQNLNLFGHQIFVEAVDRIVGQSLLLRHLLGLPDSEPDSTSKEAATSATSRISTDQNHDDLSTGRTGDTRKGIRVTDGKSKADVGKDRPKTGAKDVKTTRPGKSETKVSSTSSSRKTPNSIRSSSSTSALGSTPGDTTFADGSLISSPEPSAVVTLQEAEVATTEKLYKESFTLQVYNILGDMADRMDYIFASLKEGWRL